MLRACYRTVTSALGTKILLRTLVLPYCFGSMGTVANTGLPCRCWCCLLLWLVTISLLVLLLLVTILLLLLRCHCGLAVAVLLPAGLLLLCHLPLLMWPYCCCCCCLGMLLLLLLSSGDWGGFDQAGAAVQSGGEHCRCTCYY